MQHLLMEDRGAVRILTLNRPEKHNALNTVLATELKPSEIEVGVVGGPAVHDVTSQRRFSMLTEAEIGQILERLAERD